MTVWKKDSETGSTPQGDATLEGAVYGVYSDAACTKLVKSYKTNAKGTFETDYYRCGVNMYLKEITPPEGYLKNDKVYTITKDGQQFTNEYNSAETQADEDVVKVTWQLSREWVMESRELFHLKTVHSSKFIWQVQVHMKRQRLPKETFLQQT